MALQLGALREALIEAGSSREKAGRAAEELAGYDKEFVQLRAEMREGFFRGEAELAGVRTELKGDISELKTDIADLRAETRSENRLTRWIGGPIFAMLVPIFLKLFLH